MPAGLSPFVSSLSGAKEKRPAETITQATPGSERAGLSPPLGIERKKR